MIRFLQFGIHPRFAALLWWIIPRWLLNAASVYELAQAALSAGETLAQTVLAGLNGKTVSYHAVYSSAVEWSILPRCDHPAGP